MSLVVFLALTVVGFAYAAWSGNIEITGTVEAAKLGIKFVTVSCSDNNAAIDDPTFTLNADGTELTVQVKNAVPGYGVHVHYKFRNESTLPVKITNITATPGEGWLNIATNEGGLNDQIGPLAESEDVHYVLLTCTEDMMAGDITTFTITFTGTLVDGTGGGT